MQDNIEIELELQPITGMDMELVYPPMGLPEVDVLIDNAIAPPQISIELVYPQDLSVEIQVDNTQLPSIDLELVYPPNQVVDLVFENPIPTNIEISFSNIGQKGSDGTGVNITGETPIGNVDGSNATFLTEFLFQPETVKLYLNGLRQKVTQDYNTSGNQTIQFIVDSPQLLDKITVDYTKL